MIKITSKRPSRWILIALFLVMVISAVFFLQIYPLLPEITDLSFYYQLTDPYEEDGTLLLYSTDYIAGFDTLSPYIIPALLAIEDQRFYEHRGVDLIRILGAAVANLQSGFGVEGGSTITQQLVKITYLDQSEKTIRRKVVEAITAMRIERRYSKEEILETYLNKVYFGHAGYGLQNATTFYFQKDPEDLTLEESAIITGIIQNPTMHSPLNRPESMLARAILVINRMEENGSITELEAASARENLKNESFIIKKID